MGAEGKKKKGGVISRASALRKKKRSCVTTEVTGRIRKRILFVQQKEKTRGFYYEGNGLVPEGTRLPEG